MSVLTISELLNLAYVVETAQECAKVALVREDGDILYGHARSIGDENGNGLGRDVDVREGFLRITSKGGWEFFLPVKELAEAHGHHEFMKYDW